MAPLKRGRPPKGDRAMTPTERSQEHRARKKASASSTGYIAGSAEAWRDRKRKPAAGGPRAPSAVVGVGASEGAPIPPPANFSTTWLADRPLSVEEAEGIARFERLSAEAFATPRLSRSWTDADVQLVARLKRVARGEWLDLCELAERLMR